MKHFFSKEKISYEFKDKLVTGFWVSALWFLLGIWKYLDHYSVLKQNNCFDDANPQGIVSSGAIGLIFFGALGGVILVYLWGFWLRKVSFRKAFLYIILIYASLNVLMTMLFVIAFAANDPNVIKDGGVVQTVFHSIFSLATLPDFLFWLLVSIVTVLLLMVRDKFGPKTFTKFIGGKYFHPRNEERIFMFMDLKSSTTIAEELGEEKYFNFLNDTFKMSTPGILSTYGEIYQYVGDEIVITWDVTSGFTKANCIRCYFAVEKMLKEKSDYFQAKYGVQPEFKAGLHYGKVIAGEVGAVKREIVYSGDVLNTTARIQSLCNEKKVKILLSKKLVDHIDISFLNRRIKSLGEVMLRGKLEKVELVTLLGHA